MFDCAVFYLELFSYLFPDLRKVFAPCQVPEQPGVVFALAVIAVQIENDCAVGAFLTGGHLLEIDVRKKGLGFELYVFDFFHTSTALGIGQKTFASTIRRTCAFDAKKAASVPAESDVSGYIAGYHRR